MSIESALIAFAGDMASRFVTPETTQKSPESYVHKCLDIDTSRQYTCPPDGNFKCRMGAREQIVRQGCKPGEPITLESGY